MLNQTSEFLEQGNYQSSRGPRELKDYDQQHLENGRDLLGEMLRAISGN